MSGINFRDAYEFDPETYGVQQPGGLLGRLQALMPMGETSRDAEASRDPFNSGVYAGQQGGLLGRLQALQVEQSRYRPIPSGGDRDAPVADGLDFREFSRVGSGASPLPVISPASSQSIRQFEAGQAQVASEAAAARLSRGVRSAVRQRAPEPDPIDIAKSAGIGVVNGAVNTVGLLGEIPTGFGFLPKNQLANTWFRATGQSEYSPDEPDWIRERATADAIRQGIEKHIPWQFYQPKTRSGRYAETIGEFVPAILGSAALSGIRTGAAALRELPASIAKHAVAPGIVVQGLEDAFPESKAGEMLQKAYPLGRRALPAALAVSRYFRPLAP